MEITFIRQVPENGFPTTDIVAIVISVVSLFISVILTVLSYRQNEKFKYIDLEAEFIRKLFKDYLVTKIPTCRDLIRFNSSGNLVQDVTLSNTLNDMRRSFDYFRYLDKAFYEELIKYIHTIDDLLVNSHNHQHPTSHERQLLLNKLDTEIESLYTLVSEKYHGKRHS